MGLAAQPDAVAGILKDPTLRGRGLPARILWIIPESNIGRRKIVTLPVRDSYRTEYKQKVTDLYERYWKAEPQCLAVSPNAQNCWVSFAETVEPFVLPNPAFTLPFLASLFTLRLLR